MSPVRNSVLSRYFSVLSLTFFSLLAGAPPEVSGQTFANGITNGFIQSFEITEASGLVASRQNPGVLWLHNDSGSTLYAVSTNGSLLARYYAPTVFFGDFEDIAIGPGSTPEAQYIYLGDIGDNTASRASVFVHRFPEPAVYHSQADNPLTFPLISVQTIELVYPDQPYDAEALLVDPITGDLFVITKMDVDARVYQATRAQLDAGGRVTLTFVRQITFQKVSGGDISPDGRIIALRRGNNAARWNRNIATQSVGEALGGTRTAIPVIGDNGGELNGEALGFHATGLGYYTISEGFQQPICYFRRTDTANLPKQPVVFIQPGETWRYQDQGTNEGTAWRQRFFNDTNWSSGPAQLGYGQGDERTVISFGIDEFERNTTTYFRKQFTRTATPAVTNLSLRLCFNDGATVYLNGTEVFRRNLSTNAPFDEFATVPNVSAQNFWVSVPVNHTLLLTGTNTVAVELHRFNSEDRQLSFDLQLSDAFVELPARFTSKPQLISGMWRMSIAGPVGSLVRVEACDDLFSWLEAGQVTLTNGTGVFQEPATSTACRFYRLRY